MPAMKRLAQVGALVRAMSPVMQPGSPGLGERASCVPRLVRATLAGSYSGVSKGRLAMMLAATGYIVSPLDFVPEAILPVLGIADDALVLGWLATQFVEETERFLEWEAAQGGMPSPGAPGASGGTSSARSQTVRGDVVS